MYSYIPKEYVEVFGKMYPDLSLDKAVAEYILDTINLDEWKDDYTV